MSNPPTKKDLDWMRYAVKCVGGGEWDEGPETGAGHVWLYRNGRATGEPVFKMRGNESGFRETAAEREHQARLIAEVMNHLEWLLDAGFQRLAGGR